MTAPNRPPLWKVMNQADRKNDWPRYIKAAEIRAVAAAIPEEFYVAMTDPTPAADLIRAAIWRCMETCPKPLTAEDLAAAVLMEAAEILFPEEPEPERPKQLPMDVDARSAWIRYCAEWNCWRTRERGSKCLQALAQQLNGTDCGDADRAERGESDHG